MLASVRRCGRQWRRLCAEASHRVRRRRCRGLPKLAKEGVLVGYKEINRQAMRLPMNSLETIALVLLISNYCVAMLREAQDTLASVDDDYRGRDYFEMALAIEPVLFAVNDIFLGALAWFVVTRLGLANAVRASRQAVARIACRCKGGFVPGCCHRSQKATAAPQRVTENPMHRAMDIPGSVSRVSREDTRVIPLTSRCELRSEGSRDELKLAGDRSAAAEQG